jgi:MFS transporter, PAT family, beta-lactamase induction signal transducer AmpG
MSDTVKPSAWTSLRAAVTSHRLLSVVLLSMSSGAPLGLVLTAVPAWLAMAGVDIKTIGIVTLAQAPYAFKFVWSPLLDRYRTRFLGGRRGWVLVFQLALAGATFGLALNAGSPEVAVVAALTLLIAFASASQDIAIDAYAIESLRPHEQGLAVGARTALYRVGMWMSGNVAISMSPYLGWRGTLIALAAIYVVLLPVTIFAPEPEVQQARPVSLRAAVWEPFVSFLQKPRALEIAGFLVLYKFADNLAQALTRPFLVQMGFDALDVGVASGTIGLAGIMVGTFLGGMLSDVLGLGRALWIFGFLQAVSNLGYAVVAEAGAVQSVMYGAVAFENLTTGLGTGAFGVLLFRLTEARFSATQFALFSSIFGLGRTIAGPMAGVVVDATGWTPFFVLSVAAAIPGMVMLQRFVPFTSRDIPEPPPLDPELRPAPLSRQQLALRASLAGTGGFAFAAFANGGLAWLKAQRTGDGAFFELLVAPLAPASVGDALTLFGIALFAVASGLAVAAFAAARGR